jgi:DNA-binding NarL/FixJ family response regulator
MSHKVVHLTRREREIVLAILEGCTNLEMAKRFNVSEQTVKNQLSTLFDKVGVSSRLELALTAIERGFVKNHEA